MRSALLFLLLFMLVLGGCKKQTRYWQKIVFLKSHTTSRLNRIMFVDSQTCIIGGGEKFNKAEVLFSKDAGLTWAVMTFPESGKGLYGIALSPSKKIYLSGFDGTVVHATGLNSDWNTSRIPDWRYYIAIAYPNDDTGIYVASIAQRLGNIVRVTSDFQIIDSTSFDFGLNDIAFPTANTGYVAALGTVLKTTNKGKTWQMLNVKNDNFMAIYCLSEQDAWVCGYNGSLYHTTDGGITWTQSRNGNNIALPRYRLMDIVFKDSLHGWAVGEKGLIIYTSDGGQTWQQYVAFTDTHLLALALTPGGNLLVSGEQGALYMLYL